MADWEAAKDETAPGFDWAVEFAEVFSPAARDGGRWDDGFSFLNEVDRQPMFTDKAVAQDRSGFDIILANPPYIRMELFKDEKPILRRNFPDVHSDRADLYVYFYDRAQQLLKDEGVACFISSKKWLRAGYGENLRRHLLDSQAFHLVVDFGDLPVFNATAYPGVFLWQKRLRDNIQTTWSVVEDLQECYGEGVRDYIRRVAHAIPASQFGQGKPRLAKNTETERRVRMESSGARLGEMLEGRIMWGIKTGLNEAFFIDSDTRDALIDKNPACVEVIKPLLTGEDLRRYETQFRQSFLLYLHHGIDMKRYRAVRDHLKPFRERLESRATRQEWYELQQPQWAYTRVFSEPKIMYPVIGKEPRFAMDHGGHFCNDKVYALATGDWYILAILNSGTVRTWVADTLSPLRGGYYEFRAIYMETLPIPNASAGERASIEKLAQENHALHAKRRKRVERFLRDIGLSPAESTSRNPLEQPWQLTADDFTRRVRNAQLKTFNDARDETGALNERIRAIEREIDERVAALYGVALPSH
ncbi:MAG TPA: TaqI-like C-terminal specificity domain-containing protein [Blastocatellia bacterium]|nr:TaqI-like C-terminal specificity domain-containing protein [Blastocatellia bacterium]